MIDKKLCYASLVSTPLRWSLLRFAGLGSSTLSLDITLLRSTSLSWTQQKESYTLLYFAPRCYA